MGSIKPSDGGLDSAGIVSEGYATEDEDHLQGLYKKILEKYILDLRTLKGKK